MATQQRDASQSGGSQRDKAQRMLAKAQELAESGQLDEAEELAYRISDALKNSSATGETLKKFQVAIESVLDSVRVRRAQAAPVPEHYLRAASRARTEPDTDQGPAAGSRRTPGRIWLYLALLVAFLLLASLIPSFADAEAWAGSMTRFGEIPLTADTYPVIPAAFAVVLLGMGLLYALRGGQSAVDIFMRLLVWAVAGMVFVVAVVGMTGGLLVITT